MCIHIKLTVCVCVYVYNVCVCACVYTCTCLLSCVRLFYDPMDCSPPGFSIHGIFQARILEWIAIAFSRESFQPRDQACASRVSWITGRLFTAEPLGKPNSTVFQFKKKKMGEDFPGSSLVKTLVKTLPMQRAQA